MKDVCGREINYLRVSITDRCNFRCLYCMPEEGVAPKTHYDILSFEEITEFIKAVVPLGISKVRVTGGEPLVRIGVEDFIRGLSAIEGIEDISMTTNGVLLSKMAKDLKEAGLDRVNISLDTLKPERFTKITRCGQLSDALKGIKAAIDAELTPIKLNCVIVKNFNDDEIMDFVNLTRKYPMYIRFIELMPLGEKGWGKGHYLSTEEIKKTINEELIPMEVSAGAGPAKYYKVSDGLGGIGFITPISSHFCAKCNRIRLTADGKLKPCLESDVEIDVKSILREKKGKSEIQRKFIEAIKCKPEHHLMNPDDDSKHDRLMWQIGG